MNQQLIDHILEYMDDDTARYAIALEGPWGSGKTRFCMGELSDALKEHNHLLYRVSLFGVTNEAELYDRLLAAAFRMDTDPSDNRWQRAMKRGSSRLAEIGAHFFEAQLKDKGFTVQLSSQMLTILLGSDHLIVMDDVERRDDKKLSDMGLFGVINDLVEGQNCKIILVTNNYETIPGEVREKLIWKRYRFEPDPAELADAVLSSVSKPQVAGLDTADCIREAAMKAQCVNARAMIKARALVEKAFSAPVLENESIYQGNRRRAVVDYIKFTLMKASGTEPTEPDEHPGLSRNPELDRYKRLATIHSYFGSNGHVSDNDVAEDIHNYVAAEYPESPDTVRVSRLLSKSYGLATMDDEDVRQLALGISHCILHTAFDLGLLESAIRINSQLRELGFDESLDDEQLLRRAEELIDNNPMEAYDKIHKQFNLWERPLYEENDAIMLKLEMRDTPQLMFDIDKYIVSAYEEVLFRQVFGSIDSNAGNSGMLIAERINTDPDEGYLSFLAIPPTMIAESFDHSDGPSQEHLCRMLKKVDELYQSDIHNRTIAENQALERWLDEVAVELYALEPRTRMGRHRLEDIRQHLHRYLHPLNAQTDKGLIPTE